MGEEIDLDDGGISDFQGLGTLTSDLHTTMQHSSTSTYMYIPKLIEIEQTSKYS